jgi:hypothetical protein
MSAPSIPDLPPEQVSTILALVQEHGIRSAHYVGNADRGLIEGLSGVLGKHAVSIMDMPDRWRAGAAFWRDEHEYPGIPCPERQEWLEDIACYQEGAPEHELALRDYPWDSSDQLDRSVRFPGRVPPKLWILFGFADMTRVGDEGIGDDGKWERGSMLRPAPFLHKSYEWERLGDIWAGRWIPDQPPLEPYPDDEEEYDEEV